MQNAKDITFLMWLSYNINTPQKKRMVLMVECGVDVEEHRWCVFVLKGAPPVSSHYKS